MPSLKRKNLPLVHSCLGFSSRSKYTTLLICLAIQIIDTNISLNLLFFIFLFLSYIYKICPHPIPFRWCPFKKPAVFWIALNWPSLAICHASGFIETACLTISAVLQDDSRGFLLLMGSEWQSCVWGNACLYMCVHVCVVAIDGRRTRHHHNTVTKPFSKVTQQDVAAQSPMMMSLYQRGGGSAEGAEEARERWASQPPLRGSTGGVSLWGEPIEGTPFVVEWKTHTGAKANAVATEESFLSACGGIFFLI